MDRLPDDPYIANLFATGDPRPYRTSDFMSFNRFRQTSIYREVFAKYGMRHLLVMTPRITDQDLVLIGLTRRLRDFSDLETSALHLMRDVIAAALDYATQISAIRTKISASLSVVPSRRCTLTERENQVLALVATGHTNDQAAHKARYQPTNHSQTSRRRIHQGRCPESRRRSRLVAPPSFHNHAGP